MGLDMYLEADFYAGGGWDFIRESQDPRAQKEVARFDGALSLVLDTDFEAWKRQYPEGKSATLSFRVAYWRKANAIHHWFVEKTQGGKDECRRTYVSRDQLNTLVELCKAVLAERSRAEELLPSEGGFFFGSTEYGDWYFSDLKATVKQIETVLNDSRFEHATFYYQASW